MSTDTRGRARIGVFVPFTNTNLEPDMMLLRPAGTSLHFARLGGYDADEIPNEHQMAQLGSSDMEEPLRLIQGVRPDVVIYGCTSATLAHGPAFDNDLRARIAAQSGAKTVTAASALIYALQSLGLRRVGFASPYVPTLNDEAIGFLASEGFETVGRADFEGTLDNVGQGALSPQDVFELGIRADHPQAEAVVLSCTDMRSVEVIAELETKLGKPVVTSNQAMMFQVIDMAHLGPAPKGFGQLFERISA
ncbi:maleate cis-trans isomerase family protein [Roseovarius phycicola]|uniref:Asp/Glu racemase n=1 Tax=Roseovarius phycicola TaxID=3080976 RepID=A0ABZ2HFQ6_9RHOB